MAEGMEEFLKLVNGRDDLVLQYMRLSRPLLYQLFGGYNYQFTISLETTALSKMVAEIRTNKTVQERLTSAMQSFEEVLLREMARQGINVTPLAEIATQEQELKEIFGRRAYRELKNAFNDFIVKVIPRLRAHTGITLTNKDIEEIRRRVESAILRPFGPNPQDYDSSLLCLRAVMSHLDDIQAVSERWAGETIIDYTLRVFYTRRIAERASALINNYITETYKQEVAIDWEYFLPYYTNLVNEYIKRFRNLLKNVFNTMVNPFRQTLGFGIQRRVFDVLLSIEYNDFVWAGVLRDIDDGSCWWEGGKFPHAPGVQSVLGATNLAFGLIYDHETRELEGRCVVFVQGRKIKEGDKGRWVGEFRVTNIRSKEDKLQTMSSIIAIRREIAEHLHRLAASKGIDLNDPANWTKWTHGTPPSQAYDDSLLYEAFED